MLCDGAISTFGEPTACVHTCPSSLTCVKSEFSATRELNRYAKRSRPQKLRREANLSRASCTILYFIPSLAARSLPIRLADSNCSRDTALIRKFYNAATNLLQYVQSRSSAGGNFIIIVTVRRNGYSYVRIFSCVIFFLSRAQVLVACINRLPRPKTFSVYQLPRQQIYVINVADYLECQLLWIHGRSQRYRILFCRRIAAHLDIPAVNNWRTLVALVPDYTEKEANAFGQLAK